MWSYISSNITSPIHQILTVLMMLLFMLSKTSATHDFNKSLERKALVATKWWRGYSNASDHCVSWYGITCNEAGSVVSIGIRNDISSEGPHDLRSLDFSAFPNLGSLAIESFMLEGSIPKQVGLLSNLTYLSLHGNHLTGKLPVSLTNLTNLEYLDLSENQLTGSIPPSFGSMVNLKVLELSTNQLNAIPPSFGSMVNLKVLDLSTNQLNASLPQELSNLQDLECLNLGDNNLDGPIPLSFGNLSKLEYLNLGTNYISGRIPLELTNLTNLYYLDLNHNNLVGPLHHESGKLSRFDYLDVSFNHLSGYIFKFQVPCNLWWLDLSNNHLTGVITTLSVCYNLDYVDLSSNNLVGEIPLLNITNIYCYINFSQNHLTGIFPYNLQRQYDIDLSNNDFTSNDFTRKSAHKRNKHVVYLDIFLPLFFGICFLILCYVLYRRKKATTKKIHLEMIKHGDVCSILNYDGTIAYEDFIAATEDFDLKYCIGTGGYGSVYEAKLPSGRVFALKKLHRFEAEQPAFDQSFKNEVQVLTNLRHKNIVKLYGFCLHNKCNFLVYEYMEKGSLFCALSISEFAVQLDWIKRVNIPCFGIYAS